MKAEDLVVGKTYWHIIVKEPFIVIDNTPDSTFGTVKVTYHPSTGKLAASGTWPMAHPDNLRELTSLEEELL